MKKVEFNDILHIYEKEISRNIKNKKKIYEFDCMKFQYLNYICDVLTNDLYDGGKYNIFMVTYPKKRIVMSQSVYDKIINHYITKHILEPKLSKYLDDRNIATRKGYGVSYGIKIIKKYFEELKRDGTFYCLKIDISKYFYNIDHEVLKSMLKEKLDIEEFKLISKIIDSTNKSYINQMIKKLKIKFNAFDIPMYQNKKGLPIGDLTSQFLAIFYFYKLDHQIIHDFKIKHYVRYMDDFLLFSKDKEYLKKIKVEITRIIEEEYKVNVNQKKTMILTSKDGINFLGYRFKVKDKKTNITLSNGLKRRVYNNLRKKKRDYEKNRINIKSYYNSLRCYQFALKYTKSKEVKKYIENKILN